MTKRFCGKPWLEFELYGMKWCARIVPANHKIVDNGKTAAVVFFDDHVMYFSDNNSEEQLRTGLAHEIQHIIEEHADVDYEVECTPEVSDRRTDAVSRGWLYFIRSCPDIVSFFKGIK